MLARAGGLDEVGDFDERFFLYCEETDLCWRLKRAEWDVVHLPQMTICHFEDDRRGSAALEARRPTPACSSPASTFPTPPPTTAGRWPCATGSASASTRCAGGARAHSAIGASAALSTVIHGDAPFGS